MPGRRPSASAMVSDGPARSSSAAITSAPKGVRASGIPPTPRRATSTRTPGKRNAVVSAALSGAWARTGLATITLQARAMTRVYIIAHSRGIRSTDRSGRDVAQTVAGRELAVPIDILVDDDELHDLAGSVQREQPVVRQPAAIVVGAAEVQDDVAHGFPDPLEQVRGAQVGARVWPRPGRVGRDGDRARDRGQEEPGDGRDRGACRAPAAEDQEPAPRFGRVDREADPREEAGRVRVGAGDRLVPAGAIRTAPEVHAEAE